MILNGAVVQATASLQVAVKRSGDFRNKYLNERRLRSRTELFKSLYLERWTAVIQEGLVEIVDDRSKKLKRKEIA